MAKERTPFFSLGARGTVGGTMTAQKLGSSTLIRKKPIPAYRYTLPQAYHRWDYQDAVAQWKEFSNATKREYAIKGSRRNMTALSVWIQEYLLTLPDLVARWRFDKNLGGVAMDTSKQGNHGAILGPTSTTGIIDRALYFDGLNDIVTVPDSPSLKITGAFTIECFLRTWPAPLAKNTSIFYKGPFGNNWGPYCFAGTTNGIWLVVLLNNNAINITTPIPANTWLHAACTYDLTDLCLFVNGVLANSAPYGAPIYTTTDFVTIGQMFKATQPYLDADLDHLAVWSRALSPAQLLLHSERRYPVL